MGTIPESISLSDSLRQARKILHCSDGGGGREREGLGEEGCYALETWCPEVRPH